MCGIAGIALKVGERPDAGRILRMTRSLARRGPDGEGVIVRDNVALGHRRLAVIDISAAADQPMVSEDGSAAIVFNGEIYNFHTLRERLETAGWVFRTRSDTEVLLAAWQAYGESCLEHLRGMFVFAVHDRARGLLFLARDRLGKKPCYYARGAGWFVFGSEIKALLQFGPIGTDLDPSALTDYAAFGYTRGERSIFKEIRKLPPAHRMILDLKDPNLAPRITRYWGIESRNRPHQSEEAWLDELDTLLSDSVAQRMTSDVPLGAFLSGGVDSSLVAALMCRHAPGRLQTFTVGFNETAFDESSVASDVAGYLGTDHHTEVVTPEAVSVLPDLVRAYDEPFGDASAIPTLLLSRCMRQHVTVAVSGDGGDELFAGYGRYTKTARTMQITRRLGSVGRCVAGSIVRVLRPGAPGRRTLSRMSVPPVDQYAHALGWSDEHLSLLHADFRGDCVCEVRGDHRAARAAAESLIGQFQLLDLEGYLPDDILVKVDRASMHYGLEVRSPLLDQRLVQFALSLPGNLRVRGKVSKYLLKRLAAQYLPAEILNRPKRGFSVPLNVWFKNELKPQIENMVQDSAAPMWHYFDQEVAKERVSSFCARGVDSGAVLWRLLVFHRWAGVYL